ncbi:hypothetical protein AAVH_25700 [Aphelenchoides avenae]|nr:hypothetical protein AAVH_41663 [Aphelenchus avenae]KAH7707070.1 hypothetical protein AAVH_25700 [Aphelenchus avenae]
MTQFGSNKLDCSLQTPESFVSLYVNWVATSWRMVEEVSEASRKESRFHRSFAPLWLIPPQLEGVQGAKARAGRHAPYRPTKDVCRQ